MTRRRTIDPAAAARLIVVATMLTDSDDHADVLPLLTLALAIVVDDCNRDPAEARATAGTFGPVLAEMVEKVQAMRLADAKPEGSA